MVTPLRIGIIGAGSNTRDRHIPGLRAHDGVIIHGVANRSRASSEAAAKLLGIPTAYDNWQALIADPAIDAVCIGTWPSLHAEATIAALQANKHVLCEARMAMNLTEARAMAAAAQATPTCIAHVVPAPFTFGLDDTITDLIHAGHLGRLVAVDMVMQSNTFIDTTSRQTWRQNANHSGVNILSLGIWYESLMRWVGTARTVSARTRIAVDRRPNDAGEIVTITVPDHVEIIGDLRNGATYHFRFTQACGAGPANGVWLYGTEGTLHISGDGKHLSGATRQQPSMKPIIPAANRTRDWQVEADFIHSIRTSTPPTLTSFADGVRYMAFTQAVHDSAMAGGAFAAVADR